MADELNYFSDDEESEWLANIDPSLLGKSNEEKQLDDSEISSFIEENRNSNTQYGKNYNIIQDKIFESSREALESKRKQLLS